MVAHNYIAYFHDGIDVCTHGSPDPEEDRKATAIDFYNNDIHLMADDFIEADGGVHNIRVMRNRGVNAGQCGLSAQPVYRRTGLLHPQRALPRAHRLRSEVQREARRPGALSQHHHFRGPAGRPVLERPLPQQPVPGHRRAGPRRSSGSPTPPPYSTYDYNGYRPNPKAKDQFLWKSPRAGHCFAITSWRRRAPEPFGSLAELRAATGAGGARHRGGLRRLRKPSSAGRR